MFDRRCEQRSRTYLGGQIVFNSRWSTSDCLVRNVSASGARLEFSDPVFVPDDLELTMPLRGQSHRVRVVWRDAKTLGVTFVDRAAHTVLSIEAARRIQKLKAERDKLARRVRDLSESSI